MEVIGITRASVKIVDFSFQQLTNYMNGTLGHMLKEYHTALTPERCKDHQTSYNNSKWRVIVRCSRESPLSYEDTLTLLAMLASDMEEKLGEKFICFPETELVSMIKNDRRLVKTVYLEKASMELWETSRSSPNFLKSCVDTDYEFQKTEWAEWKKVIGL
ncbi:hypothetical protein EDD11_010513 [Mortierella claussenii]|nr:hypothetical protein EDD11_010513 [Mortierella claussenii]